MKVPCLDHSVLISGPSLDIAPPFLQDLFESSRKVGLEGDLLPGAGMDKSEGFRMQCLSRHEIKTVLHKLPVMGKGGSAQDLVPSVFRIIEDGVRPVLEMNPDLVGASCFKPALDQVHITQTLQYPVMCNGLLSLSPVGENMPQFAVHRVA